MITVGVDEAGRGAWAGPIVAAAVLIDESFRIDKLTDSKKLTKLQRAKLLSLIKRQALAVGIGWVNSAEIDRQGLATANKLAMVKALAQISQPYDMLLVDGNIAYLPGCKTIIGGDLLEPSISAASVVAKVVRDAYMQAIASIYPDYGFDKHVGYGTNGHSQAIERFGVIGIHRKSFKPIAQLDLII